MDAILSFLTNHKELLALGVGSVGGAFALWRWMVDQKWRRVQYAQSLIKEFLEKNTTVEAFNILDVSDEEVEFSGQNSKTKKILITDTFLIGALSTFDQKTKNTPKELVVRIILDGFFDDLNIFQNHVDTGLIKLRDLRPYLEYWIKELVGQGRSHKSAFFGQQVCRYLNYFGYEKVVTLAKNMGYRFPEVSNNKQRPIA